MTLISRVRAHARAAGGAVFGAAVVVLGGVVAFSSSADRDAQRAPDAARFLAAASVEATGASAAGSRAPAPEFMGGARLSQVNDAAGPAMPAFSGAADDRSLQCLSTAVYYEARGEGSDGMAAVAQVILNRSRHPSFPGSVCGVVYQASQFSFVGARNRAPSGRLWEQARAIAERALSGHVMDDVGTATHFHATRVRPSWPGMRRVATIGQHVFYAYAGGRGARSAFTREPQREYARPPARTENVYAMLSSERPDAPAPSVTSTPSAAAVDSAKPARAADAPAPAAPAARHEPAPSATETAPAAPALRTQTLVPAAPVA